LVIIFSNINQGKTMKQATKALHAGYEKDSQKTMSVPIYMSTAFDFGSADFAASSFNLESKGRTMSTPE